MSEFSSGIRGELPLGASTIPGEYLLPELMGLFKKEHPHFFVSLKIADTQKIVQDVLQDKVELGITGAKLIHPSLHYEKYEADEIIVVGPPDHRLIQRKEAAGMLKRRSGRFAGRSRLRRITRTATI